MKKILACVDGSSHFYSICDLSSWINGATKADISLLHVATPHHDVAAKVNFSGSIGFGAKTKILNDLVKIDEEHGRAQQNKGQSILDHAMRELKVTNLQDVQRLHLRGGLSDIVQDVSQGSDVIIIGRSGENSSSSSNKIGSNLESVVRLVNKPILVASMIYKPIESILIAYDGTDQSLQMVKYASQSNLLNKLQCHLLFVGPKNQSNIKKFKEAEKILAKRVTDVKTIILEEKNIVDAISGYFEEKYIDLLVMGAYNNSKLRSFIVGSKTSNLINKIKSPILLFR
ncbi:universal stress protein [Rickettsiales bacterium]|nr:universal stress protein [Rickettsiales bacterium]